MGASTPPPPRSARETRLAELRADLQKAADVYWAQCEALGDHDPSLGLSLSDHLEWALHAYHARTLGILTEMQKLLEFE